MVHQFTPLNPEKTNVHNRENWRYPLENQDESSTPPQTPPSPEYHSTPSSDNYPSSSSAGVPPLGPDVERHGG
ncbi:hypothetical protein KIW84_034337 [Lathyrus oleraceus]|uniref:Uncharacterized protein n=1 Tax=Pisum sativum TaxID=3888 RepID=A0A9D4XZ45_PEA|nr:hypothetical protein KIW84_034337 [Pisum sativum]